ncbi:MAG: glycosyltransferase family 2 protein [Candidatus Uhrbacteria bacterium]
MKPKVAIIYLSYNARPYIDDVVLSLEQQTYSSDRLKLIIVDNPGKDDSLDYIQKQIMPRSGKGLPEIELIANQKNTGFAVGNNQGIKLALEQGYDYVYLLNNDAKLDPEAIERAVEVAEADLKIGSVQSLMLLWQNPEVINSTGGMVHFLGFGFVRDNGADCGSRIVDRSGIEIAYASGAAVLYRADLLRKIGMLDEFLWLYHEDLELGWRIRLAGYKNVLAEKSIAYHHYEFSRSIQKWFWMERNRWIVLLTHLRWGSIVLLAPALLLTELAIYTASIRSGWIKEKFLSCVDLLRPATLKNIVAKRRVSQEFRKVSDREIVRLFTAKIEHQETSGPILKYLINPAMSLVWYVIRLLIRW